MSFSCKTRLLRKIIVRLEMRICKCTYGTFEHCFTDSHFPQRGLIQQIFLFMLQRIFVDVVIKLQLLFLTFCSIYFYFMFFKVNSHFLASYLIFIDTLDFLQLSVNVLVLHSLAFFGGQGNTHW